MGGIPVYFAGKLFPFYSSCMELRKRPVLSVGSLRRAKSVELQRQMLEEQLSRLGTGQFNKFIMDFRGSKKLNELKERLKNTPESELFDNLSYLKVCIASGYVLKTRKAQELVERAIYRSNWPAVEVFLGSNLKIEGGALIAAASMGRLSLVRDLLQRGIEVDATDEQGCTALMMATLAHHIIYSK